MALAGKINEIYVLAGQTAMTDSTGNKVGGVDDSTYSRLAELLEVTQFGDDFQKRIAGLKDSNVSISGSYDPSDTNGQLVLEPGDFIYIGIYPEGPSQAGKQVPAIVENFEQSASVDGRQEFSCTIQGNGEPVTLPARA